MILATPIATSMEALSDVRRARMKDTDTDRDRIGPRWMQILNF